MFDITKKDLKELLKRIHKGELQLPEFQRSYVWADPDVRALLASVLKGFPVGALLTLQNGGDLRFKHRVLAGAPDTNDRPENLLLDGQQRMTSLYQASFVQKPVKTRSAKGIDVERLYYLDIKKALELGDDLEDAIRGMPADRIQYKPFGREIELDLSTQEQEFRHDMFPINQIFNSFGWLFAWKDYWKDRGRSVDDLIQLFHQKIAEPFQTYEMPIIQLDKKNSREAICLVFEKVNVGGKKLDAFELVTAIYAADEFNLREDWDGDEPRKPGRHKRIVGHPNRRDVLTKVANTDFLAACTLLHTRAERQKAVDDGRTGKDIPAISCKREALLALPLDAYRAHADAVQKGFVAAGAFLNEQKIIWHKDVPYPSLIVALAAASAILGGKAETAAAKEKLARWFWSITLGELYGSSTETRLAIDVPELVDWIGGTGRGPRSLDEALFQKDRLRTMRTRLSAAYKGLHALIMRQGCRDFITGSPTDIMTFANDKIDIHHVFPQDWCKKQGISPALFNSIVNKTPLSKRSNIMIGGDAPSVYLKRIEQKQGLSAETLNDILRSHHIDPVLLRADDFDGFFKARLECLADVVAGAMGKAVVPSGIADEVEFDTVTQEEIEENDDLDAEAA
ncbi:GmrSD restriction endonuclease domain-containing protein [Zavarzinia sp. CC-PAN008]|uniref:GmrSD restriction endonuclease domain-containing protein n=1 Tax=Zavarzinia sp. CC-PAN008 TaxID=3243332 RepID=UPI003F747A57